MSTTYDIYDTDTANLVGSFTSEWDALVLIRRAIEEDGTESVASWSLGPTNLTGRVLSGRELIDRAKHEIPAEAWSLRP